jgi:molybdopterin converting factor subunit 1
MRVKVRLFARLRDLVGSAEIDQAVPEGATIATVWDGLVSQHPALADYSRAVSCARNDDFSRMQAPVRDGDEIAFLPPVSGG